jgi:long-chain fatty acid transport protein
MQSGQIFIIFSLSCLAALSYAGSPYQPEVGTASSDGTAGAANPTNTYDASALRTNPAGLTQLAEPESLFVGGQTLSGVMRFKSDIATAGGSDGGNAAPFELIPSVFYSRHQSEDWSWGVGLAPSYGLGAEYGESFVGRYLTITTSLAGAGIYASAAYQLNDEWSIGLSGAAIYTTLELSRAVSNTPATPSPATDGKVTFDEIDDWSPQVTLGVLYSPTGEAWSLGLVYRSKTKVDLKGDLKVVNAPLPSGTGRVSFDMPESYEVGLAYQYSDKVRLYMEADLQRWSQFSDYSVDMGMGYVGYDRGWRDSYRVALGTEYQLTPHSSIFAGTSYDMSPVVDRNRTFDAPTDEQVRISSSYIGRGKDFDYSFGLSVIRSEAGRIDQTVEVTPGSGFFARTKGEFSTYYIAFMFAAFEYRF